MDKSYFEISEEIKLALKDKKPVVALESTLISHGLPYPINLNVAKQLFTQREASKANEADKNKKNEINL